MHLLTADHWTTIVCSVFVLSLFAVFSVFIFPFREWTEETKKRPRSFISNALFREFWYFVMTPLKTKFIKWEVLPNTITLWGFVFSILSGFAFGTNHFGMGGWLVILASTCDVYDGMLARARNISLQSGAFFDSTLDRVGELAMFFGPLWYFHDDSFWFFVVFVAIASSQVVSYARARAEGLGFSGSKGFFQRAERMICLSIGMSAVPLAHLAFGESGRAAMIRITVGFIALGSLQTAVSRSVGIFREIKASEAGR